MSRWGRAGLAGGALGVAAVGAALGVGAERWLVGRTRLRPDPEAREPFGRLPGEQSTVVADDGVPLHVETTGPAAAPLTVVFCHGYTNESAVWHYQRKDLAGPDAPARLVFFDQRSHGRSGRSSPEHATIDWLGRDLHRVVEECAPHGPLVLVGHSMGGMTIMALADRHPELFGERVVGVALVATSTGRLAEVSFGVPAGIARLVAPFAPRAVAELGRRRAVVERGRRAGSDLGFLLTRRLSFGGSDVSPAVVELVERMTAATPIDVIADFYPTFAQHDKLAALDVLRGVATLVLVGERDLLTPPDHSRRIAEALPEAELVVVPDAGHMVMLERPALVTLHLRALLARAARAAAA